MKKKIQILILMADDKNIIFSRIGLQFEIRIQERGIDLAET